MHPDIKLTLTIIATLILMFATSLLLDLALIQRQIIRQIIIYLAITIQFAIGFLLVKIQIK